MEPIRYIGPDDGNTVQLVDQVNDGISRGWPIEKILQIALSHLYGVLGQQEHMIKELRAKIDDQAT